jgi:enediyne polyketide synthase
MDHFPSGAPTADISATDSVIASVCGDSRPVVRRRDGKPEVAGLMVSAAHSSGLVIGVAADSPIGCDLETVSPRPIATWRDLLGPSGLDLAELIVAESGGDFQIAATRVWTALEALVKAGRPQQIPLRFRSSQSDGWVTLESGAGTVATGTFVVGGPTRRFVLAVYLDGELPCGDSSTLRRRRTHHAVI